MDEVITIDIEPCVSSDGKMVVFVASARNQLVQCSILRAALEQHFWLPPRADTLRMLKAFTDGQSRIIAVAERKLLKDPGAPVALTPADFSNR